MSIMKQRMTSTKPFLSVIIPSYNEKNNLERGVLREVDAYLQKQSYDYEVLLSDDGSTDGTLEILEQFAQTHQNFRLLANIHGGKGPTVKAGMLAAKGEWRLFTDFDQSTPIAEIEKLLAFTDKYDIIVGSREGVGAQRESEPIHRHIMGRVFNMVVQVLAVRGMKDTQCGFKLFSAKATETLFPALYIYGGQVRLKDAFTGAFDVELLFLGRKYGFKIKEVGVRWLHFASNRVSPFKDSLRMFRDILRIRLAYLSGKYSHADTAHV